MITFGKVLTKLTKIPGSQLHATTIDGINGEANIANYWRNHLHGVLNSNASDQALKNSILGTLDDIQHDARMTICYTDVPTLTLSDPGYFRQLTIRGGGGALKAPPTISKTIVSIFTISYMWILPGVLGMIQLEFFKNSRL